MASNLECLDPQTFTIRNLGLVDSLALEVVVVDSLVLEEVVVDYPALEVVDSLAWEVAHLVDLGALVVVVEAAELRILCLCLCFLVVVREIWLVHNLAYTWGNQGT